MFTSHNSSWIAFAFLFLQSLFSINLIPADAQAVYNLTFTIRLDFYPNEISWIISADSNISNKSNSIILSGNGHNASDYDTIRQTRLINDGCYRLTIYDSFSDGMDSDGNWGWFTMYLNDTMITIGKQTFHDSQADLFFCTSLLSILLW